MVSNDLAERVLEIDTDVRVLKNDVASLKGDVSEIGRGVRELISRDAKRPEPFTGKTLFYSIAGAASGAVAMWAVVTHLIGASEPVAALGKSMTAIEYRLSRLDDPKDGKIATLETRMSKAESWITSVTPAPTFITVNPSPPLRR